MVIESEIFLHRHEGRSQNAPREEQNGQSSLIAQDVGPLGLGSVWKHGQFTSCATANDVCPPQTRAFAYGKSMSVRPPNDLGVYDDIDILDLDDIDRRPPGQGRRPRNTRPTPQPGPSWTDPRFLIPLLLFLTAVFLIGMAFRSNSVGDDAALLDAENQVIEQTDLARNVQEAELRAGFGGLTVTEQSDVIIIEGSVPDNITAASVGAVARSVEGTQRVENRVVVAGGAIDATATPTSQVVVPTGVGDLSAQLAAAGNVTFDTGKTTITNEGAQTIDAVASLLNQAPGMVIEVHGHTDSDGDETANQVLSQSRAEAVVSALAARGVDANRLTAVGFGESNPIAPNITADGRATNRRIEFVVQ